MNLLHELTDTEIQETQCLVNTQLEQLRTDPAFAHSPDLHPATFARYFLPHLCRRPFCPMHYASFARYQHLASPHHDILQRTGRNMALAAPRGSAKSSIHTLVIPLLDICLQRELYIVIVSATAAQASLRLRNIARELQGNRILIDHYSDVLKPEKPWTRTTICVGKVRVDAVGALSEIRGISHGEARPTKIILDDAENSRRALTPEGREQVQEWYDEVIENLGDTYTQLEVVGTILHRRSLLSALLTRTGWDHALYKSIIEWSPEAELWEEWQQLYTNLLDDQREENAASFYREHEARLTAGTRVLWPERETYLDLIKQQTVRGRAAISKEKQNSPISPDELSIDPSKWKWFRIAADGRLMPAEDRKGQPIPITDAELKLIPNWQRDLTVYGYLDPAGGQNSLKGDYAAIVTIGKHTSGMLYVLDIWMKRCVPEAQVQQILALNSRFKYSAFYYEGNSNQNEYYKKVFNDEILAARKRGEHQSARITPISLTQTHPKSVRIFKLLPCIEGNGIQFSCSLPEEVIIQAEDFPRCKHDDAIDALGSLIMQLQQQLEARPFTYASTPRASVQDSINFLK